MKEVEDGIGGESFLPMYVISGLVYKSSSDFDQSLASSIQSGQTANEHRARISIHPCSCPLQLYVLRSHWLIYTGLMGPRMCGRCRLFHIPVIPIYPSTIASKPETAITVISAESILL